MSRPIARTPRIESLPTIRSVHASKFSESAHLEDLDGDDDDPIAVPLRTLASLTVPYLSYLINPDAKRAPVWTEPPSSSLPVLPPLRC